MRNLNRPTAHHLLLLAMAGCLLGATAQAGDDYSVAFWTVDGGGIMTSSSASWTLSGTIGQFDATPAYDLEEFPWRMTGGFWSLDLQFVSGFWFRDGFELSLLLTPEFAPGQSGVEPFAPQLPATPWRGR